MVTSASVKNETFAKDHEVLIFYIVCYRAVWQFFSIKSPLLKQFGHVSGVPQERSSKQILYIKMNKKTRVRS